MVFSVKFSWNLVSLLTFPSLNSICLSTHLLIREEALTISSQTFSSGWSLVVLAVNLSSKQLSGVITTVYGKHSTLDYLNDNCRHYSWNGNRRGSCSWKEYNGKAAVYLRHYIYKECCQKCCFGKMWFTSVVLQAVIGCCFFFSVDLQTWYLESHIARASRFLF